MARSIALLLALGCALAAAHAQEKPAKAPTPGHGVIFLKEAWETNDADLVVARYAEPGASFLRSDLAALKSVEHAEKELARAVSAKLGAAASEEIVPQEKRLVSPLVGASVTLLPGTERIRGDHATTKFRVATRDGERFFRFTHVLVDGDWKIVLSGIDGVVLDGKALERVKDGTAAHARAAEALLQEARGLDAGSVPSKDTLRKRIVAILEDERRTIDAGERGERHDDGHEND